MRFADAQQVLLDIQRVVSPEAIMAGGYLRDKTFGKAPKDLDIFIPFMDEGEGMMELAHMGFREEPWSGYADLDEVCTVWSALFDGFPVQVIELAPGMSPVERVKLHDFGLCQAWWDGASAWLGRTQAFGADMADRCFTLVHCESKHEWGRSMRRYKRLTEEKYKGWPLRLGLGLGYQEVL